MHKERKNYGIGILLKNFQWRAVLRGQFILLLFLRVLASSILSFVTGLGFVVKNLCFKNGYWLFILIVSILSLKEKTSLKKMRVNFLLKYYPEYQCT